MYIGMIYVCILKELVFFLLFSEEEFFKYRKLYDKIVFQRGGDKDFFLDDFWL